MRIKRIEATQAPIAMSRLHHTAPYVTHKNDNEITSDKTKNAVNASPEGFSKVSLDYS